MDGVKRIPRQRKLDCLPAWKVTKERCAGNAGVEDTRDGCAGQSFYRRRGRGGDLAGDLNRQVVAILVSQGNQSSMPYCAWN
jgi:hypothetical protein